MVEEQLRELRLSFDDHRKEVTSLMKSMIELQTKQTQHDEQDRTLFSICNKLSDRVRDLEIKLGTSSKSVSNNERLIWLVITGIVSGFFYFVRG